MLLNDRLPTNFPGEPKILKKDVDWDVYKLVYIDKKLNEVTIGKSYYCPHVSIEKYKNEEFLVIISSIDSSMQCIHILKFSKELMCFVLIYSSPEPHGYCKWESLGINNGILKLKLERDSIDKDYYIPIDL